MNLLFIGSRVIPVVCIVGAVHLTFVNTFFPMSEEQKRELEARRNAGRLSRFQKPNPVPRNDQSETIRDESQTSTWGQELPDSLEKSYGMPVAEEGSDSNIHR